ncbi:MAG: family 10 glycosylhydrolase, partial [Gemmatimonadota bacterium]
MKRRAFLELASAGAATAAFAPQLGTPARLDRFRAWTWVHGNNVDTPESWRAKFARFRNGGVSGVLVGGGNTAMIAAAAKDEGLAFHAWTWIMNRSGDAWVKANHPDWFNVSRKGESSLLKPPYVGYYQWLCPSRPEVRDYLCSIVKVIAETPGVDAVHLDYIRHPDVILPAGLWARYNLVQDHEMPEYDFCYCTVCRDKFKAQSGYDPQSLPDPTSDVAWREFRWNSIIEMG